MGLAACELTFSDLVRKVQYRATYANTGIICRDVSTVACMYMLYLLPIINDENLLDSNASLPWPTKSCELSNMSNAVFPSLSPVLCPFIIFFHLYSLLLLFLRFRKLSILFLLNLMYIILRF